MCLFWLFCVGYMNKGIISCWIVKFEKVYTLTTARCSAGFIWFHNRWGEQKVIKLNTDYLGGLNEGPLPWSTHPSCKHCFNRIGRVNVLRKASWYVYFLVGVNNLCITSPKAFRSLPGIDRCNEIFFCFLKSVYIYLYFSRYKYAWFII